MQRVFNFSAGPSTLPLEVLQQAQQDLLDWQGTGMSVMEMSHRSSLFVAAASQAETDLRKLLSVPENYKVLFMQGGATAQFSLIPLNLSAENDTVDYFDSGIWAAKAIKAAQQYAKVNLVATGSASKFTSFPDSSHWQLTPDAAYCHYTGNETIGGLEFHSVPDTGTVPLVADMSSTILSRPLDVSKFALIYAGAQKNIGPAGVTIVIVRDDLLGRARQATPEVFNYAKVASGDSMLNTPPTFAWYLSGLVFQWLLQQGGLHHMAERNQQKAQQLYQLIDQSEFYSNPVDPAYRSWMNVPFLLAKPALEKIFLAEAGVAQLQGLAGHRSVGGMRASIYNAMPKAGVDALCNFMTDFERRYS